MPGVPVEKKVHQGAFKARGPAQGHDKAAACKTRGTLEVQSAKGRADVVMRARFKVKLPRFAPAAYLDVFVFVGAHRHGAVGNVGHAHEQVFHVSLDLRRFHVQFLDAV